MLRESRLRRFGLIHLLELRGTNIPDYRVDLALLAARAALRFVEESFAWSGSTYGPQ
ncbi:MAG: hypothetical protein QMC74_07130 [Myxococcota bacterium]